MGDADHTFARLFQLHTEGIGDPDSIRSTLMAAVFGESLLRAETPRVVLDDLWKSVPADDAWPEIRDYLTDLLA